MLKDLIYVYCLTRNPTGTGTGLTAVAPETLRFGDFYVVIKYVAESEFSEENLKRNLSNLDWLESNAREHISIISKVMDFTTAIPFKFGTIYNTIESLGQFISVYSGSLNENFDYIGEKEEWSVKIYCDRKALSEQIDELSAEAADLEKQIMASSPGKAFLLKRKKQDLIENEMDRICKQYGQNYFNEFRALSEASGLNNLLPKDYTGRTDTMILNATFLVHKNKADTFVHTAEILREKGGNSGFCIEATGPWPPFSFISIKEK